eukprot:UN25055
MANLGRQRANAHVQQKQPTTDITRRPQVPPQIPNQIQVAISNQHILGPNCAPMPTVYSAQNNIYRPILQQSPPTNIPVQQQSIQQPMKFLPWLKPNNYNSMTQNIYYIPTAPPPPRPNRRHFHV